MLCNKTTYYHEFASMPIAQHAVSHIIPIPKELIL